MLEGIVTKVKILLAAYNHAIRLADKIILDGDDSAATFNAYRDARIKLASLKSKPKR